MRPRGFTLVEILIVIALLGVMVAIAMPRFHSTATTGQAAKCKANLQTIEMALETYYSENGVYPASGDLSGLVNAGYLKLGPTCTDQNGTQLGTYSWNADPTISTTFTFSTGVPTTLSYGGGRAFCNYHGTLNAEDWHPKGPPPSGGGGGGGSSG
jgi:prepilin-type N-terminal cleavage/methylation domain-containing protein